MSIENMFKGYKRFFFLRLTIAKSKRIIVKNNDQKQANHLGGMSKHNSEYPLKLRICHN